MKQKANILWVALTTFVMGYVVSALTQSGHAHSGAPAIIRIARPEANASAPTIFLSEGLYLGCKYT